MASASTSSCLALDAGLLVFHLALRHGHLDAGHHAAVRSGEVDGARPNGPQLDVQEGRVQEVLQLPGLAVQAVRVPGDHRVDVSALHVGQHPVGPLRFFRRLVAECRR
jgi:hypothetical protein